jgi:tetratricopeptide (TPR) repeat protein
MTALRSFSLAATTVLLLAGSARADMVQLKDGRFVEGVPLKLAGKEIVAQFKNGEVHLPLSMVETYVIEGAAPPEPDTDEAKAKAAQGLVQWKGKWMKPAERDKAIKDEVDKRRAAVEDAKKHSEWRDRYKFSSKYFDFESTAPPSLNQYYSQLLDAYFEVFKKDWSISSTPKGFDAKLKVCFYPNEEMFHKTGGAPGGVLAYYRFVPPRELNFYNERRDPRLTETVMFHECNHYLVDLFGQGLKYPHFIGEAMAEYYGASTYDPKTKSVKFGQIQEGRLAEIRSDIDAGKNFTLQEYMEKEGGHYEDYYWGWSFVHFMMETPAYQKKFKTFFIDLARAKDVQRKPMGVEPGFYQVSNAECIRVFKDRFGIKDLAPLDKEWHEYVEKLKAPGVRGYEEAGKRAYGEGRVKFRAPRLLKAAVDLGSVDTETLDDYADCLRGKQQYDEALAIMEKAIQIDPLDGDLRAHVSYVLNEKGDKDGAKKALDLARELNPDGNYIDVVGALRKAAGGGGDDGN